LWVRIPPKALALTKEKNMGDNIYGEITYIDSEENVCHSDYVTDSREFMHKLLDEWLDNGLGTGIIFFGDTDYLSPSL
jgi:hypothetical protein